MVIITIKILIRDLFMTSVLFSSADFGNSDVFVIVTTQSGQFYIYEYMFAGVNLYLSMCLLSKKEINSLSPLTHTHIQKISYKMQ